MTNIKEKDHSMKMVIEAPDNLPKELFQKRKREFESRLRLDVEEPVDDPELLEAIQYSIKHDGNENLQDWKEFSEEIKKERLL